MEKDRLLETFKEYVNKFDMNEHKIKLKYFHSLRVMDLSEQLAEYEKLTPKEKNLAIIVGLLHDYARFPQWTKYKTFSDIYSIDHGDYAVELLFDNKEIEQFNIKEEDYSIIYDAIKFHNKYEIPENIKEENKTICQLIRDTDKLDILYLLGNGEIAIEDDISEVTPEVRDGFYRHQSINKKSIKNYNDKIILNLCMIYDLNFEYSYQYIKENDLLNKIYEKIKNKEIFKEYFEHIENYVNERTEENVRKKIRSQKCRKR